MTDLQPSVSILIQHTNLLQKGSLELPRAGEAKRRQVLCQQGFPTCGCRIGRWVVFNSRLVKRSVPIIEVYPQTLMREDILDNDVGRAVMIDVESGDREAALGRGEGDVFVLVRRQVKFDPERSLPVQPSGLKEDGAIWFLIAIEVSGGNLKTETRYRASHVCASGRESRQPILGLEDGRPQSYKGQQ